MDFIDLEHFQPFEATTYTLISRFSNSKKIDQIEYFNFDESKLERRFQENIPYNNIQINGNLYLSKNDNLDLLQNIKQSYSYPYVSVKNGFATLADKVFIGDIQTSIHIPTKTLLFVIHLPEIKNEVKDKNEYVTYYTNVKDMCIYESKFDYGKFSSAVIYNDYEDFASKVVHYIQFI